MTASQRSMTHDHGVEPLPNVPASVISLFPAHDMTKLFKLTRSAIALQISAVEAICVMRNGENEQAAMSPKYRGTIKPGSLIRFIAILRASAQAEKGREARRSILGSERNCHCQSGQQSLRPTGGRRRCPENQRSLVAEVNGRWSNGRPFLELEH